MSRLGWVCDDDWQYEHEKEREIVGALLFAFYCMGLFDAPCSSTGICGAWTRGYGRLSFNGYWEFPIADYPGVTFEV